MENDRNETNTINLAQTQCDNGESLAAAAKGFKQIADESLTRYCDIVAKLAAKSSRRPMKPEEAREMHEIALADTTALRLAAFAINKLSTQELATALRFLEDTDPYVMTARDALKFALESSHTPSLALN